jgi:hypothetical protein
MKGGQSIFIEYPQEDLTDVEVELLKDTHKRIQIPIFEFAYV